MNNFLRFIFIVLGGSLLVGTTGCKSGVSLSETDFKEMYSGNSDIHQPQYKVYHSSNEETEIHYMFENRSLTYAADRASQNLTAQVKIAWQLYSNYTSEEVTDSASFIKYDTTSSSGLKQLQGVFKLKANQGANYILKVTATDLNNQSQTINFININKTDITTRQYFKVI